MYIYRCSALNQVTDQYIYAIHATRHGLATIGSDDGLHILDYSRLREVSGIANIHQGVSCVASSHASQQYICTTGRDGEVAVWDVRHRSGRGVMRAKDEPSAALYALACNKTGLTLATGSALSNGQATVSIRDLRNFERPYTQYIESHSDDLTDLHFHPTKTHMLISGATDCLANVFNTSIVHEDDALHQTINDGHPVHHAVFPHDREIFVLSHDENLSHYRYLRDPFLGEETQLIRRWGDMRGLTPCMYVIDIKPRPDGGCVLGLGSYEDATFELVHMTRRSGKKGWDIEFDDRISLVGAHGEEIVRCFEYQPYSEVVFTGGEDGIVRAWNG